jgi:predicted HTH domain antitoxin
MRKNVDIRISVPEEILLSLREDINEFAANMKLMTAMKLYESHKLTIGQGAELADLPEEDFIKILGKNQISIFGTMNDIRGDYQNA